jgi:hypothetical protein
MSAPFEERSGVVPCATPWGQWYQTLEEVFIEVEVPPGTRAQDIQCGLQSRHVALAVGGRDILKVEAQVGLGLRVFSPTPGDRREKRENGLGLV